MENKQGIFLRDMAEDSTDAVIDIVGVIGWEVWYPEMKKILQAIPETAERVVFDIYSPGGDIWEGNAIIQQIGALKKKTVARVQVAASMATLIAVACDEREIAGNGRWLIHNPWTATQGDAEAHEKRAKELRDCEKEAVKFYADRTEKTQKEIKELMAEERWLTPKETLEFGFVQKINDPFDAKAFEGVKAEIVAAGKWPQGLVDIPTEEEAEKYECECIECGAALTSNKHCKDLKCEKCGGQMRRKERPGPGQGESKNENAKSEGSEGESGVDVNQSDKPADETKVEELPGYSAGLSKGLARTADLQKMIEDVKGKAQADIEKRDETIKKIQSERDKARAEASAIKQTLDEANIKLDKLLAGGMTFTAPIETWEEAMQACKGDYVKARAAYPDAYRMQRERDKQKRNGGK